MIDKVFVVDLDGCLSKSDILEESLIVNLIKNPFKIFPLLSALLNGKVAFKRAVYRIFGFDPSSLSYDQRVIELCNKKKKQGYRVVLCTGSLHEIAIKVQGFLGVFDDVIGTDQVNNTGAEKVKTINNEYPGSHIEYIGNSQDDIPLFEAFSSSFLINYKFKTLRRLKANPVEVIGEPVCTLKNYFRMLRPHQWSKNILAFVALVSSHSYFSLDNILLSLSAFFCLSLCASSHYIVNDILDIASDRKHETKRAREIPAGNVSLLVATVISLLLFIISLAMSYFINNSLFISILAYFIITNVYSFILKKKLILDVVCLAVLFTIRVISGALAIDVDISPWLLSTSFFFFFSLALLKRKIELSNKEKLGHADDSINGRAYKIKDIQVINSLGISSGMISCLVFALFISTNPYNYYSNTGGMMLWFIIPAILYWISYVWILSERSKIDEDPIKFAIKDRTSLKIFLSIFIMFIFAGSL